MSRDVEYVTVSAPDATGGQTGTESRWIEIREEDDTTIYGWMCDDQKRRVSTFPFGPDLPVEWTVAIPKNLVISRMDETEVRRTQDAGAAWYADHRKNSLIGDLP